LLIETLMIRFNHEKVRPPLELEGQGGLLMHVRRAIDFVANNPVGDLSCGRVLKTGHVKTKKRLSHHPLKQLHNQLKSAEESKEQDPLIKHRDAWNYWFSCI
jgi:hypothetical protein